MAGDGKLWLPARVAVRRAQHGARHVIVQGEGLEVRLRDALGHRHLVGLGPILPIF